jgi:hypothetical protein
MTPAELAIYEKEYAERLVAPAPKSPLPRAADAALMELLASFRAIGAEPTLLIPPTTGHLRIYPRTADSVPMLDFYDFNRWPEFYLKAHRSDAAHLNKKGSELYTRALVERYFGGREGKQPE